VGNIAGSLGSVLSFFSEGPSIAVTPTKQAWEKLGKAIEKGMLLILRVFRSFSAEMLDIKSTKLGAIADIAGSLGTILEFFMNAPVKAISVVKQNWAALGVALVQAMNQLLSSFRTFSTQALKAKSERMGFIGTMVGVLSGVVDLATSVEENIQKLRDFMSLDFGAHMWTAIGLTLGKMFRDIDKGIGKIPDSKNMQRAQEALSSLASIFSDMVAVSNNVPNRANLPAQAVNSIPATELTALSMLAVLQTISTNIFNLATTMVTANGSLPENLSLTAPLVVPVTATVAPSASSTSGEPMQVNVTWQTYTGEPSEREKKALVSYLKPALDKEVRRMMRTGF
jgi:hypothetical protein